MKVSLNWAQYYSNVNLSSIGRDKLLQKIGAQLGGIEEVDDWGVRFEGVVVVKIVGCQPHPEADKLQICTIDDGGVTPDVQRDSSGLVQLVCGGPNAREGILTAWIPPNATVPSTLGKEPLKLEVREIRGVPSPGMLATPHELGISEDHSGILEISPDDMEEGSVKPGTQFKDLYGLDDIVVDIENKMFTHRPDCFGVLGIARELAGIQGLAFKSPEWYINQPNFETKDELPFEVKIETPQLVPRFMAVAVNGIKIGSSPMWMQSYLARIGVRSINNIVDITNYVMHTTGQPMHAFDYDKIRLLSGNEPTIGARLAKEGEELTLLGDKKLKLTKDDLILTTDKQAVDLAGVMGGADTEVGQDTTSILLTIATFDMYAVRHATMRHGVFTDAAARYTKGQSPLQNDKAMTYALKLIAEHAGGKQASDVKDVHGDLPELKVVQVSSQFINERLGSKLSAQEISKLLTNVEFEVEVSGDNLKVKAPFWRTDVEIAEDVVEEVGRLYGYDQLAVELPKRSIKPTATDPLLALKTQIRNALSAAGANEVLTYSFVHGDLIGRVGQDKSKAFELANAISPDLQYYRLSLLPSLLDKVHLNIKQGFNEFALFELNAVHSKDLVGEDKLPLESQRLGFIFVAEDKTAGQNYQGAAYFVAKKYLNDLIASLEIEQLVFEDLADQAPKTMGQAAAPLQKGRSAVIKTKNGEPVGLIGELKNSISRNLKLPAFVAGFELGLEQLVKLANVSQSYQPIPRFPKVEQDITLKVPASLSYDDLFNFITKEIGENQLNKTKVELLPLDIYQKDPASKNVTFRLTTASYERTLTTEEVSVILEKVAEAAKTELNAERV